MQRVTIFSGKFVKIIILITKWSYIIGDVTLRKNPRHSDVMYVVENVLNYFLCLNSSNGWPVNVGTKSVRRD